MQNFGLLPFKRIQTTETRAQSPFMHLFIANTVLISHNSNGHFQMTHTIRHLAAFIAFELILTCSHSELKCLFLEIVTWLLTSSHQDGYKRYFTRGLNDVWCGILLELNFTKLFGIGKFSGEKDSGKVLIIIIILFLIINFFYFFGFCWPRIPHPAPCTPLSGSDPLTPHSYPTFSDTLQKLWEFLRANWLLLIVSESEDHKNWRHM